MYICLRSFYLLCE